MNLDLLKEKHRQSGLTGTVSAVRPLGRFGEIEISDGKICEFDEKPYVSVGHINGGFMIFDTKKALNYFREGEDLILEAEVLPKMVKDGQLGAFNHHGFWQCVDTVREYNILNKLWSEGKAPWKVW